VRKETNSPPPAARHGSYRSGFAFGILSFLAISVLGVIPLIFSSRIYGVRIIGQYALVSAPVLALWVLSTAKEQAALIKEITGLPPHHPRITQLFAVVFTFSSGLTIVMSILAGIVTWLIFTGPLHQPELVAPALVSLAGYALVTNTGWNIDSVFSAFVAGRQLFWVRTNEALSFLIIVIVAGLAWHSIWGLVVATIGASLSSLVHRIVVVRHFVRVRLSLAEYREGLDVLPSLLHFGLKITPGGIAQGLSLQAGVWTLGALAPVALVGAYSRAETIPGRLQQVNIRLSEVLYPTLVRRKADGDGAGFDRALVDSIRYALVGLLLVAATFGGAAHAVLDIFGPGFSRAAPALSLLMLFPALSSVSLAQNQALFAVNRPGLTSFIAITRLLVTIVLTVILTPRFGVAGPAIALLVGFMIQILWGSIAILPVLSCPLRASWPRRERFTLLAAYAAGFAAAAVVENAVPSIGGLILSLTAGVVVYTGVFLAGGGLNDKDRVRLAEGIELARSRRVQKRIARKPETSAMTPVTVNGRGSEVKDHSPDPLR
jgi:O-antigen/teichoic acid export membrane protein